MENINGPYVNMCVCVCCVCVRERERERERPHDDDWKVWAISMACNASVGCWILSYHKWTSQRQAPKHQWAMSPTGLHHAVWIGYINKYIKINIKSKRKW